MDTDHIDVYLVHHIDDSTPIEETARALDDLVHQGKVRYIGCCNHAAWQACKALWVQHALKLTPYMCMQNPYNLLYRTLEREVFPFVRSEGLGIMVYSPLAVGMLSGFYKPDAPPPEGSLWAKRWRGRYETMMAGAEGRAIATLFEVADELGKTPAQVALAWVLSHPEVTVAITGGRYGCPFGRQYRGRGLAIGRCATCAVGCGFRKLRVRAIAYLAQNPIYRAVVVRPSLLCLFRSDR